MIQIEIPKDIRKYEAKLIGPLTTRQTVCFLLAVAVALPLYFSLSFLPNDFKYILIGAICAPILLAGWIKPFGVNFEDFIRIVFITNILSPKNRIYKINNPYSDKREKTPKEIKELKKKLKKSTDKELCPYQ